MMIPSTLQSVSRNILHAAESQPPEAIEHAIRSFEWIGRGEMFAGAGVPSETLPQAGTVVPPAEYARAGERCGDLVPADQLMAALRDPNLRPQQGIASFLQSGIEQALAGLKPKLGSKSDRPDIPEALNDLLAANKMQDLNASRLQPSMDAVKDMFATLKKAHSANTDLQVNRMRFIRA